MSEKYTVKKIDGSWWIFEGRLMILRFDSEHKAKNRANELNARNVNLWGMAY